jgi:DNA repair exonuclease SbcCD ATPase subunit
LKIIDIGESRLDLTADLGNMAGQDVTIEQVNAWLKNNRHRRTYIQPIEPGQVLEPYIVLEKIARQLEETARKQREQLNAEGTVTDLQTQVMTMHNAIVLLEKDLETERQRVRELEKQLQNSIEDLASSTSACHNLSMALEEAKLVLQDETDHKERYKCQVFFLYFFVCVLFVD